VVERRILPRGCNHPDATHSDHVGAVSTRLGSFATHSLGRCSSLRTRKSWKRYELFGSGSRPVVDRWPADGRWYGNSPMVDADVVELQPRRLSPRLKRRSIP